MVSVVDFETGPVPLSSAVAAGNDVVTGAGAVELSSLIAGGATPGLSGADQFLIALTVTSYVTCSPSLSLTEMSHLPVSAPSSTSFEGSSLCTTKACGFCTTVIDGFSFGSRFSITCDWPAL